MSKQRNTLLGLAHKGCKALFGDDEETRRDWQEQRTGCRSCADMTTSQLDSLVKELRRKKALEPRKEHHNPQAAKIRALWADLHRQGIVRNGSDKALNSFCYRMTAKHRPEWLSPDDANKIIEALKAMRGRQNNG